MSKSYLKSFGLKAAIAGAECTPEMLAKINSYALTALTADQVFVRKFLMAHNCIDRDNECFPSDMLDQFATSMPGKSMLEGHDRRSRPCGKWFDATTEEMTPEQFKAITNVEPRLPDGATSCKVLWSWGYMLKTAGNDELIAAVDGGICDHCSIGFAAADLTAVRKDPNGPAQYYQYVSPGEALEGSLVWLGAQPGATAQKALHVQDTTDKGESTMKMLVAMLVGLGIKSLTETATEDQIAAGIKALNDEKDAKIKALEPLAEEGKAYRKSLVEDAVKFGSLIDEVPVDADAQKKESDFLATLPLDRLKMTRDKFETKAREKFPTHTIFTGKDQGDREDRSKEGEQRSQETKGKKDFSSPAHNELFGTVGQ
jgi:hypothetical protein